MGFHPPERMSCFPLEQDTVKWATPLSPSSLPRVPTFLPPVELNVALARGKLIPVQVSGATSHNNPLFFVNYPGSGILLQPQKMD